MEEKRYKLAGQRPSGITDEQGGGNKADRIDFSQYAEEPDLREMSREALQEYWETVRERIALLDEQEPEDMDSEEYESWGDRHEALEDLADEILDRLDELGGRL